MCCYERADVYFMRICIHEHVKIGFELFWLNSFDIESYSVKLNLLFYKIGTRI
jgi:hypothetical protein